MPSPPALTCISAADGDPKWVHDPRAVEASDNGDKDINREPCALDRREFASSALRVARFLAFSPAVVLWVVHNEAWGQGTGAAQGADTAAITAALHHLDPTRLVTDASGWGLTLSLSLSLSLSLTLTLTLTLSSSLTLTLTLTRGALAAHARRAEAANRTP